MTRESLDPYFRPSKDSIPRAIVWMRLPELPIEYWKRDFALRIVAAAGRPIEIDTYTRDLCKGSFARACLEVDLTKPLVGNQDRNHRRGRKALVFEIRKKSLRESLFFSFAFPLPAFFFVSVPRFTLGSLKHMNSRERLAPNYIT